VVKKNQSEGQVLDLIVIFFWTTYFPDEHQVSNDRAKGVSAAKQKDPRHVAAGFKMLPQMPRHSAPVTGDQNVALSLDPS